MLGRVDGIRGYHDITRYPSGRRIPGLVLFRWAAPLFFANAELFHQRVLDVIAESPTLVRRIIVTAEPVTSIDVTAADMLAELEHSLTDSGIRIAIRRDERSGQGQAETLRIIQSLRRRRPYPTIRRRPGCLAGRARGRLEILRIGVNRC